MHRHRRQRRPLVMQPGRSGAGSPRRGRLVYRAERDGDGGFGDHPRRPDGAGGARHPRPRFGGPALGIARGDLGHRGARQSGHRSRRLHRALYGDHGCRRSVELRAVDDVARGGSLGDGDRGRQRRQHQPFLQPAHIHGRHARAGHVVHQAAACAYERAERVVCLRIDGSERALRVQLGRCTVHSMFGRLRGRVGRPCPPRSRGRSCGQRGRIARGSSVDRGRDARHA